MRLLRHVQGRKERDKRLRVLLRTGLAAHLYVRVAASQQSLSEHMAPGERARQFVEARRERGGKRGQEEAIDAARQVMSALEGDE
eukprot:2626700-Rhodomonas_salina.1